MVSRINSGASGHQAGVSVESATPDMDVIVPQVQAIANQIQQQPDNDQPLPAEKARKMTESMNQFLESANTQLRFKFHDKLNEYYVTIIDSKTDEVIREIPSKKLMDIHAAMREFVGLLVDRKI